MSDMRVYVGTYAKYNSGSIFGKWLEISDYYDKAAFIEACSELHSDEEDPEFMFQDWESIPESHISESHIDESVWKLSEAYEEYGIGAVNAYLAVSCGKWSEDDFSDRYRGEFKSWEDMAEELVADTGMLDSIPENLRYYFDYEKYARDIRLNGDMVEHDGYFFWN